MTENNGQAEAAADGDDARLLLAPADFVSRLSAEERTLLVVRDDLYEGSWCRMKTDLHNRLSGKPYIFKLVNRIEADLEIIERLRVYEERHSVNLGDYVERE